MMVLLLLFGDPSQRLLERLSLADVAAALVIHLATGLPRAKS
ncbi:hypothetical protein [Paracoccus sp. SSK6]